MKKIIAAFAAVCLTVMINACGNSAAKSDGKADSTGMLDTLFSVTDSVKIDQTVYEDSFMNISPGDEVEKVAKLIKKDILSDGEGDFQIYRIKSSKSVSFGYFMPDPNNEKLVGDITITSPKVSTEKGIHVGDTFEDLTAQYGKMEVHGSEIEGRTYASKGNLKFRLDTVNNSYEVDESTIRKATKITEIVIGR